MKKTETIFLCALVCCGLSGCSDDADDSGYGGKGSTPKASFSVSEDEPYKGSPVTFSNTSSDAERYEWNFGDGSVSTEESPTHTYSEYGSFSASLTAYNGTAYHKTAKLIKVTSKTIELTTISATLAGKKYYSSGKLVNGKTYKYEFTIKFKNSYYGYKAASKWGLRTNTTYSSWDAKSDEISTLEVKHYTNNRSETLTYQAYAVKPGGHTYGDVFGAEKKISLSY